jgi:hypothetical protein
MLVRITAFAAIISSAVAFALIVVLLTSGNNTANAESNFWLQVLRSIFNAAASC